MVIFNDSDNIIEMEGGIDETVGDQPGKALGETEHGEAGGDRAKKTRLKP